MALAVGFQSWVGSMLAVFHVTWNEYNKAGVSRVVNDYFQLLSLTLDWSGLLSFVYLVG